MHPSKNGEITAAAALYGLLEDVAEEIEDISMEAAANLPQPPNDLAHIADADVQGRAEQTRYR